MDENDVVKKEEEKPELEKEEKVEEVPVASPTPEPASEPAPAPVPVATTPTPVVETPTSNNVNAPAPATAPAGVNGPMPAELNKFNWGAFLLSWIWGIGNKSYLTLLVFLLPLVAFIPVINMLGGLVALGLVIWFGIKGNEWAWHNRHFEGVEEFKKVQKAWTIAGIIVAVVGFILSIVLWGLLFSFLTGVFVGSDSANISDDQSSTQNSNSEFTQELDPTNSL